MKQEKLSFERDLWGQCNKLHERVIKKKHYLKSLLKSLESIYDAFKDLKKKLDSLKILPDPTISKALYTVNENSDNEEQKLYGIPLTISKYIKSLINLIDYNNQTFFHITMGLEDLLKKIKKEKEEYENFVKCLKNLADNKVIMEKNMKFYHQKMSAAENSVLDLKNVEIRQLSISNDTSVIENKKLMEDKANILTNDAVKPFKIYLDSVKKANEIREESIERQKHLLYKYQSIEEDIGKSNTSFANLIFSFEKYEKESTEKIISDLQVLLNNLSINKRIKQLILDFKGNEKPEKTILFIHFPSTIKFDESDDKMTFEVYKNSVEFIKEKIQQEYPDYDEQFEKDKNDLRELLYKLFKEYDSEKAKKIKEYLMNAKIHSYFLILLSKLRTNNRYEQDKIMIDFLGDILNNILDKSEQTNNYSNSKNCIILSETFYYNKGNEKYYILEKIKNHKWLAKPDYWINYGELMIDPELNKLLESHPEITKEDILTNNPEKISKNIRKKLSDIIYSQILPFVNNMKDFGISLKNIIEITEGILHKFDFLNDEEKDVVFSLISENKEEVDKLRENYKNKKQLKTEKENNEIDDIEKITNEPKIEQKKIDDSNKKTNAINNKKLKENENKTEQNNQNNGKNIMNIYKSKDKDNKDNEIILQQRSATVVQPQNYKNQKNDKKENDSGGGLFKNLKNKFLNKDKKNKEAEDNKVEKKEDKKEINQEQKNLIKKEMEKKMIKINFNSEKLQPLKPIPKNDNNKKENNNDNKRQSATNANPFGVVLKKIDKGKK